MTSGGLEVEIGPLHPDEVGSLQQMFAAVVAAGQGFPHSAPLSRDAFEATWSGEATTVVAARVASGLAGAYYLRPNFPGRAAHVANAGYVVDQRYRGRGIGRALVQDSIVRAPVLGYDAIQFNLVFESNPARALYEALGWRRIGTVPRGVNGEPALIYWRDLQPALARPPEGGHDGSSPDQVVPGEVQKGDHHER